MHFLHIAPLRKKNLDSPLLSPHVYHPNTSMNLVSLHYELVHIQISYILLQILIDG